MKDAADTPSFPIEQGRKEELDLDQFLPYRLNSLADRISQSLSAIYAERFDINVAQWRVLAWLSHQGVLTAKQIGEVTRMDKARVSRAVHALLSRELISRRQSDQDQRMSYLRLTPSGEALLSRLIPAAHGWEATLIETLTGDEYRDFLDTMRKLEYQLAHMEGNDG